MPFFPASPVENRRTRVRHHFSSGWGKFATWWKEDRQPHHSTPRWALHHLAEVARTWPGAIGLLLLPLVGGAITAYVAPQGSPHHPPGGGARAEAYVLGYLAAFGAVLFVAYVIFLTWAPYEQKRKLINDAQANKQPVPLPPDPRFKEMQSLNREGEEAMSVFLTSESHLHLDEAWEKPAPQGRTYDEWHEAGSRGLREWLSVADTNVGTLLGSKAQDEFASQRQEAPLKPVPNSIRADHHGLWLDCAHRLDWLKAEMHRRWPKEWSASRLL